MRLVAVFTCIAALGVSGCGGASTGVGSVPTGFNPGVPGNAANPFPAFGVSVNAYRAPTVNPLAYNVKLHGAAQTHANDMSTNGFFSHTGSDGSQPWDRVSAQGYSWGWVGENIAQGQGSADAALTAWKNSPGHDAILLSSQPTEFALAWASGNYWVMVLARH